MALDAFLIITPGKTTLPGGVGLPSPDPQAPKGVAVEVSDFDFGVVDPVTIGAGSGGSGAGKAHYAPFIVTRAVDGLSPTFLTLAGLGSTLSQMELYVRDMTAAGSGNGARLAYDFKTVVITNIAWSGSSSDEMATEQVTFQYASLDDLTSSPPPVQNPTATPTGTTAPTATGTSTGTATPTGTGTATPTTTGTTTPTATGTTTGGGTPLQPPDTTPELGSGELLATGAASIAGTLLYRRLRANQGRRQEAGETTQPQDTPPGVEPDEAAEPSGE
jgi:type VI protein secretion system component Hcp